MLRLTRHRPAPLMRHVRGLAAPAKMQGSYKASRHLLFDHNFQCIGLGLPGSFEQMSGFDAWNPRVCANAVEECSILGLHLEATLAYEDATKRGIKLPRSTCLRTVASLAQVRGFGRAAAVIDDMLDMGHHVNEDTVQQMLNIVKGSSDGTHLLQFVQALVSNGNHTLLPDESLPELVDVFAAHQVAPGPLMQRLANKVAEDMAQGSVDNSFLNATVKCAANGEDQGALRTIAKGFASCPSNCLSTEMEDAVICSMQSFSLPFVQPLIFRIARENGVELSEKSAEYYQLVFGRLMDHDMVQELVDYCLSHGLAVNDRLFELKLSSFISSKRPEDAMEWWSKLMRHEARPSRRTVEFLFHHFNRRRMFRELIDAYHYVKEHGLFVNLSGQVDVSTPHFLDSRGFHSGEDQQFGRTEPLTLVSDWLYMLLNACLKEKDVTTAIEVAQHPRQPNVSTTASSSLKDVVHRIQDIMEPEERIDFMLAFLTVGTKLGRENVEVAIKDAHSMGRLAELLVFYWNFIQQENLHLLATAPSQSPLAQPKFPATRAGLLGEKTKVETYVAQAITTLINEMEQSLTSTVEHKLHSLDLPGNRELRDLVHFAVVRQAALWGLTGSIPFSSTSKAHVTMPREIDVKVGDELNKRMEGSVPGSGEVEHQGGIMESLLWALSSGDLRGQRDVSALAQDPRIWQLVALILQTAPTMSLNAYESAVKANQQMKQYASASGILASMRDRGLIPPLTILEDLATSMLNDFNTWEETCGPRGLPLPVAEYQPAARALGSFRLKEIATQSAKHIPADSAEQGSFNSFISALRLRHSKFMSTVFQLALRLGDSDLALDIVGRLPTGSSTSSPAASPSGRKNSRARPGTWAHAAARASSAASSPAAAVGGTGTWGPTTFGGTFKDMDWAGLEQQPELDAETFRACFQPQWVERLVYLARLDKDPAVLRRVLDFVGREDVPLTPIAASYVWLGAVEVRSPYLLKDALDFLFQNKTELYTPANYVSVIDYCLKTKREDAAVYFTKQALEKNIRLPAAMVDQAMLASILADRIDLSLEVRTLMEDQHQGHGPNIVAKHRGSWRRRVRERRDIDPLPLPHDVEIVDSSETEKFQQLKAKKSARISLEYPGPDPEKYVEDKMKELENQGFFDDLDEAMVEESEKKTKEWLEMRGLRDDSHPWGIDLKGLERACEEGMKAIMAKSKSPRKTPHKSKPE